jgi:hypothetical protein
LCVTLQLKKCSERLHSRHTSVPLHKVVNNHHDHSNDRSIENKEGNGVRLCMVVVMMMLVVVDVMVIVSEIGSRCRLGPAYCSSH